MNAIAGAALLAVLGAVAGYQATDGGLFRRDSNHLAVRLDAEASWHLEEPREAITDEVGGSAAKNAFMGEEQFLQDASNLIAQSRARELKKRDRSRRDSPGGQELMDLTLEKHAALTHARTNSFEAEQPFLTKMSEHREDTGVFIKWAFHPDKCVYANEDGSTDSGGNPFLSIETCSDASKADNMKFVVPSGDFSSGLIKWQKDPTKCMYVHNGWQGNGNAIYLNDCNDNANFQAMNFSIFTPATSGVSAITWSKDLMKYPSHCLDVTDGSSGIKCQLWDCSAGAMWQFDSAPQTPTTTPDPDSWTPA